MLALIADSITDGGHRLTTVLCDEVEGGQLAGTADLAIGWAINGGPLIITGPGLEEKLGGDPGARLAALIGAPARVDLHAPFATPTERRILDPSMVGQLSCARAAAGGAPLGYTDAAEKYLRMLLGPPENREAMHHVAVPAAIAGLPATLGRFPGWITWGELLRWRGEPC